MKNTRESALQGEPLPDAVVSLLKTSKIVGALEAPLIYFDAVSNQGGVYAINMTLVRGAYIPVEDGSVQVVWKAVASLRCTREAAAILRTAIDVALSAGEAHEGPKN